MIVGVVFVAIAAALILALGLRAETSNLVTGIVIALAVETGVTGMAVLGYFTIVKLT